MVPSPSKPMAYQLDHMSWSNLHFCAHISHHLPTMQSTEAASTLHNRCTLTCAEKAGLYLLASVGVCIQQKKRLHIASQSSSLLDPRLDRDLALKLRHAPPCHLLHTLTCLSAHRSSTEDPDRSYRYLPDCTLSALCTLHSAIALDRLPHPANVTCSPACILH